MHIKKSSKHKGGFSQYSWLGLFLYSPDWQDVHAPVEGNIDPGYNNESQDVLSSSDQQVWLVIVSEVVYVTQAANPACTESASILESINMGKYECSYSKQFIEEEEGVCCWNDM